MVLPTYTLYINSAAILEADFFGARIERHLGTIFDRLEIGNADIALSNVHGRYSPEANTRPSGTRFRTNSDHLIRTSPMSAAANSKLGMFSAWIQPEGTNFSPVIFESLMTTVRFSVQWDTNRKPRLLARDINGSQIMDISATSAKSLTACEWHHILWAWDVGNNSVQCFYDRQDVTPSITTSNLAIHLTSATAITVGVDTSFGSASSIKGCVAQVYFQVGSLIQLSSTSNLDKFITANGRPKDLGSSGDSPTGSPPILFLPAIPSSMGTNQGYGNNFTAVGSTPPCIYTTPVAPGMPIKIDATWNSSTYTLFTGRIDAIDADPELVEQNVTVRASDTGVFLKRRVDLPMLINTNPQSLFAEVVSAMNATVGSTVRLIPSAVGSIDNTLTDLITFTLMNDITAGEVLSRIGTAGGHYMYIAPDGTIRFRDRNTIIDPTPVASLNEFYEFRYSVNNQRIINDISLKATPRKQDTVVRTVAFITNAITIPSSNTAKFFLSYIDPDTLEEGTPASSIQTPVSSENYLLAYDVTSAVDFGATAVASVRQTAFADTALVEVTNNSSVTAYLIQYTIYGRALQRAPEFQNFIQVTSSSELFDVRPLAIETDLISNYVFAQSYVDYLAQTYSGARGDVRFSIRNEFPTVFSTDLLDTVHLTNSKTSVSSMYTIFSVGHMIDVGQGVSHTTTYLAQNEARGPFLKLGMLGDAAVFNGTSAQLNIPGDVTSGTDGGKGLMSFWLTTTNPSSNPYIYSNQSFAVLVQIQSGTNKMNVTLKNSALTTVVALTSTVSEESNTSSWQHYAMAWDTGQSLALMFRNGTNVGTVTTMTSGAAIDYTRSYHVIGASPASARFLAGELAQFYLDITAFLDLRSSTNLNKFYNAGPVDLSSKATIPTGSPPLIFMPWIYPGSMGYNYGYGGTFTQAGSLSFDLFDQVGSQYRLNRAVIGF